MKTVCAASVLYGREAFGTLGDVVVLPDHLISAADVRDAEALIIRSQTSVDAALVRKSRLRFVGTATSGGDHMDLAALEQAGIAWAHAPGCNAASVAEYLVCAVLWLAERRRRPVTDATLGVVGVGQIGTRVCRKAEFLGMKVLQNDPPRRAATGDTAFRPLEEVLAQADFITLHVPLTRDGPYPTVRMANCRFFSHVKPGCGFINTARGEVVDSDALLLALERGAVAHAVLDVWEHEPYFRQDVLQRVDLGTPHIAGYSLDGKLEGTLAVYRRACEFFEIEPAWTPPPLAPPGLPRLEVDPRGKPDEQVLWEIVRAAYDIEADDRALRAGMNADDNGRGAHFVSLRLGYPVRREFPATQVTLRHGSPALADKVAGLGFSVSRPTAG